MRVCYQIFVLSLFTVSVSSFFVEAGTASKDLFEINKKKISSEDLPKVLRQQLYDVESHSKEKINQIINNYLFETHVENLAKKEKKEKDKIIDELLQTKPASDADAKKWYENNVDKIGKRPFNMIKQEIIGFLNEKKSINKKNDLIKKIKETLNYKSLLPEITPPKFDINVSGFPTLGAKKSSLTLVEFADYQCPHCKMAALNIKKILKKYESKMKFVYIDFPINHSGISKIVAEGASCANEQNKYWEFHDLAFENQRKLNKESPREFATQLQLDMKKFEKCLETGSGKSFVAEAKKKGADIGVTGTPALFLNGVKMHGYSEESLEKAIKEALKM